MEHSLGLALLRFTVTWIANSSRYHGLLVRIPELPDEGWEEDEVSLRQLEEGTQFWAFLVTGILKDHGPLLEDSS